MTEAWSPDPHYYPESLADATDDQLRGFAHRLAVDDLGMPVSDVHAWARVVDDEIRSRDHVQEA